MKRRRLLLAPIFGVALMGGAMVPWVPSLEKRSAACTAPEHRQFDFWLGDWDTFERNRPDSSVARNRVSAMVGGCAIREVYEQNDGLVGESFSAYDASRKVWHQSWVTNRGQVLLLDGTFRGGRMVLEGPMPSEDGRPAVIRGTWWLEGDAVREVAESSTDGGKSWKPVFDITFRRRRP